VFYKTLYIQSIINMLACLSSSYTTCTYKFIVPTI